MQLDTWVAEHEEEEARAERAQQAAMAEDGWTVVVRSKVSGKHEHTKVVVHSKVSRKYEHAKVRECMLPDGS